jgi:hypothetical protein
MSANTNNSSEKLTLSDDMLTAIAYGDISDDITPEDNVYSMKELKQNIPENSSINHRGCRNRRKEYAGFFIPANREKINRKMIKMYPDTKILLKQYGDPENSMGIYYLHEYVNVEIDKNILAKYNEEKFVLCFGDSPNDRPTDKLQLVLPAGSRIVKLGNSMPKMTNCPLKITLPLETKFLAPKNTKIRCWESGLLVNTEEDIMFSFCSNRINPDTSRLHTDDS